jgi:hypothetical protein
VGIQFVAHEGRIVDVGTARRMHLTDDLLIRHKAAPIRRSAL